MSDRDWETKLNEQRAGLVNSQKILTDFQQTTEQIIQGIKSAEISKTVNESVRVYYDTLRTMAETDKTDATTKQIKANTDKLRKETEALVHKMHGLKVEGKIDQSTYGEIMRYVDRSLRTVQTAGGVAGS